MSDLPSVSRVITAGAAASATLLMVAAMSSTRPEPATPVRQPVRVQVVEVVTHHGDAPGRAVAPAVSVRTPPSTTRTSGS